MAVVSIGALAQTRPTPVATVTVMPATATIAASATEQLTAALADAGGNTITGRVVAWTTSDATKATVSSAGVVTGVAAGEATITATCEGQTDTCAVTVEGAAALALTAWRLASSGSVLSSNGILLHVGQMAPAAVTGVALFINDAEVSCYVEALAGLHADDTSIALLLQANITPENVTSAELRFGVVPGQARLEKAAVPTPYANAVLLPSTSAGWLASTILPAAPDRAATPAALQDYDTYFDNWEAIIRAGTPYDNKWGRGHAYIGAIARDPDNADVAEWYKVAMTIGKNYRDALEVSFDANGYCNNPGQSTIAFDNAWYYWLTGDEDARYWMGREACNQIYAGFKYPDGRINHWNFVSGSLCALMESTGDDPYNSYGPLTRAQYVTQIGNLIDTLVAEQITAEGPGPIAAGLGGVAGPDSDGISTVGWWLYSPAGASDIPDPTKDVCYYLAAMGVMGAIWAVELLPELSGKKAAVLTAATTMIDAAIAQGSNLYNSTSRVFKYDPTDSWPAPDTGGGFYSTAPWIAMVAAWVGRETPDTDYTTWADTLFSGVITRTGDNGTTEFGRYNNGGGWGDYVDDDGAFNQYATAWTYFYLRGT